MLFEKLFNPRRGLRFDHKYLEGKTVSHFTLRGSILENCPETLDEILAIIRQDSTVEVVLSLSSIAMMNSIGIHQWALFLKKIDPSHSVYFEDCSSEIIDHINLIPAFKGDAIVRTFQTPYVCLSCESRANVLTRVAEIPKGTYPKPPRCRCGAQMELEQSEEDYFRFLEVE